ncbi:SMR family transporter [Vibrio tritonius]
MMLIMPWFYLLIAGFLEIVRVCIVKHSSGFTRLIPLLITILIKLSRI